LAWPKASAGTNHTTRLIRAAIRIAAIIAEPFFPVFPSQSRGKSSPCPKYAAHGGGGGAHSQPVAVGKKTPVKVAVKSATPWSLLRRKINMQYQNLFIASRLLKGFLPLLYFGKKTNILKSTLAKISGAFTETGHVSLLPCSEMARHSVELTQNL
jgi:hypothetical protein